MKNMADIMRQAQEMQAKIAEAQEKAEQVEVDGVASAGLVKMTLNMMRQFRQDNSRHLEPPKAPPILSSRKARRAYPGPSAAIT